MRAAIYFARDLGLRLIGGGTAENAFQRGVESYSREVAAEDRRAELIEKMTSGLAAKTL